KGRARRHHRVRLGGRRKPGRPRRRIGSRGSRADDGVRAEAREAEAPLRRGQTWWATLVPRSGSEQQGTRPVIVVSHDAFNAVAGWRSVIVVPVSSSKSQA